MTLRELTSYLPKSVSSGDLNKTVVDVTDDSREVKEGFVFVAVRGSEVDGHKYIEKAIEAGAAAIVAEIAPDERWQNNSTWIHVSNSRLALASIANHLQGQPSAELKVIGVTGTNGKTTTTYLAHHIMQSVYRRAGLMGTVKFNDGLEETDATHTTPGSVALQKHLRTMVENGCRGVAMEVSSHGIEQNRVEGVQFDATVFTNLTQDHLDYHGSMEAYFAAKKKLFAQLKLQEGKKKPVAVINLDDRHGETLVKELGDQIKITTYGMGAHCDFKATKIRQSLQGTEFQLDNRGKSFLVRTPLIGRFNVYNTLAAIASCAAVGVKVRDAVQAMSEAPQVPGRMELVGFKEGFSVFVDYAHTPDALKNVCSTLRELEPTRLITVFGCGGDRDQKKRPLMGEAASEISDICLITSDNPRSEKPEDIIAMIEKGMKSRKYRVVADREEAIRAAVNLASKGDVVLIAGKGHEAYQQFAEEKIDFDDRKVARWALRDRPAPKQDNR